MTICGLIYFYLIIQIITADIYVYNNLSQSLATIEDQDPEFEPTFPKEGLKGYLIVANPSDACHPISSPPSISIPGYQWIVLIRRSTANEDSCSFNTKIINGYHANFNAVIIYNYEDQLISMSLTDDNIKIPSTFITHTDGIRLMNGYLFNQSSTKNLSGVYLKILPTSSFPFGVYLIPFIVIISVSFFCLLGFMLCRWCLERRRSRRHRLPRSALKQLQTKKYVKTDPWEVCAICLDDYEEGAKLRILPCQHAYHMKCIDPWLINNRRQCPCCKRYVFPNHDNSDGENDDRQQQTATERTPLITSNDEDSTSILTRNHRMSEQQTSQSLGPLMESSDEEKDDFLTSGPERTATTTTAELVFERSSINSRQYGSFNGSSNTARGGHFFIGSTTDNTSVSERSTGEDIVDNHFEENQAFVNDEHSINSNQTYL